MRACFAVRVTNASRVMAIIERLSTTIAFP
jgi:hypothetical protein